MAVYLERPPMSPLARVGAALVALATLVGAFMLGLVFLAVAVGLGLLVGTAAWLRVWWLRRTLGREAGHGAGPGADQDPGQGAGQGSGTASTIDAEYTVIATERRRSR